MQSQTEPFISRRSWWLPRTSILFIIVITLSILHHIDHVLRVDHSGWPFIPQVTPFTFSLLIYVIYLYIAITPFWPWFRVAAMAVVYLVVQAAHIFVEPPTDQFQTWAYGSHYPWARSTPTLFITHSPIMGTISVVLSLMVSVAMILVLLAFIRDAIQASRRNHMKAFTVAP